MANAIPKSMPAAVMRKLNALAEQRCSHLANLHASGRWVRYYGKEQFAACMAQALEAARTSRTLLLQMSERAASAPQVDQSKGPFS
jgi:hypothetical protein